MSSANLVGMPAPEPDSRETGMLFALGQTGLEMVAPVALGAYLDYTFGWSPWGVVIGAILGFGGGTLHLIVLSQQIERERSKKKNGS